MWRLTCNMQCKPDNPLYICFLTIQNHHHSSCIWWNEAISQSLLIQVSWNFARVGFYQEKLGNIMCTVKTNSNLLYKMEMSNYWWNVLKYPRWNSRLQVWGSNTSQKIYFESSVFLLKRSFFIQFQLLYTVRPRIGGTCGVNDKEFSSWNLGFWASSLLVQQISPIN